jgi:hypothetical protein
MQIKTPIVFIIYNRPEKTERVFSVIKKIKPKYLYIIADGPKNIEDEIKCNLSREITKCIDWEVDLKILEADYNMGNVPRTISGLDWVFSQTDKAIILEDDCIPDISFFYYCETLLEYYNDDHEIMHISGYNILQETPTLESSYFFSKYILPPWGWATWKRAWEKYNPNMDTWQKHKKEIHVNISQEHFNTWTNTFEYLRIHKIGWDIPWNIDIWACSGLGIIPSVNLIENIGFDEEATYTKKRNQFAEIKSKEMKFPLLHPSSKTILFDKEIENKCISLLNDVTE